tara:strand:- start:795 stop:986 length:192 start_codon:yes stop_codon:yes gene_type:complete
LGAKQISALFLLNFKKMEENNNNKNKVPTKMARLAWPKAKYGLYLAVFIIIATLIILYKDIIL